VPISDSDGSLREYRLQRLTERLPAAARPMAHWLRSRSARPVRIPAGLLLCLGGALGALPLLGFWMLPAGVVLLAEDVPPLRRATGGMLAWLEHKRPRWFVPASGASQIALPEAARSQ
jgi:hypothetical protein